MLRLLRLVALTFLFSSFADSALAALGDCGQPLSNGATPVASDCLFILRAAVGSETCDPACICDTNGEGGTTATDALVCLKKAVGQSVTFQCPCGASSTIATSTTITTTTSLGATTSTVVSPTSSTSSSTTTTVPAVTTTTPTTSTLPVTTTVANVTTTTSVATTTTLISCTVRFRLTSTDTIGGVVYDTKYQLIFGVFVGSADGVQCTPLVAGVFQFNDNDASKILTTGYTNNPGLTGPADLADCTYQTNDAGLAPSDFQVIVTDATAPDSGPVDATVVVSQVTCD